MNKPKVLHSLLYSKLWPCNKTETNSALMPRWLPISLYPMQAYGITTNPLSPDIKMHILLTVLHTFLMQLVRRICLNIKTSYPW